MFIKSKLFSLFNPSIWIILPILYCLFNRRNIRKYWY